MSLLTNPPAAGDVAAGILFLDADLCYVFDNLKVPSDVQAVVAHLGYVDLQVFAKIEDTPGKVREIIKLCRARPRPSTGPSWPGWWSRGKQRPRGSRSGASRRRIRGLVTCRGPSPRAVTST